MRNSTILFIVFAFLITFLPTNLFAQRDTDSIRLSIDIDEVIISATRSETRIADLPLTIGIISKNQIEETMPMTPVEALKYEPGIVRQSDGGLVSTPIIRGLSRERAPVLIDGNPFVGGRIRTFSLIDPFQVERIEVVKGPASAFWGSDAVGGLINMITRKAESGYGKDFKIGGSLYGGFQSVNNHLRGRAELEGRGNGLDFLIGVGGRNADNITDGNGDEILNSQFESTNLDFNIGYSFSENQRLELSGKYFKNDDVGFPGGLGAPGPPRINRRFAPDEQQALNVAYDYKDVSDKISSIGVRFFYKRQELHIDQLTNIFFPMTMNVNREIHAMLDVDVPNIGGKFFMSFNQKKKAKLTVGLDYINEHRIGTHRDLNILIMNPMGVQVNEINRPFTQIQPDSEYQGLGLFAIEELHFGDKLDALIALRYDNVRTSIEDGPFDIPAIAEIYNDDNRADNDNAVSGNLGVKFKASETFSLTANLANSFRATDLFSKYHFTAVGAGFLVPNPNLNPERGVFYELGAKFNNKKVIAGINFYQNKLTDLFVQQNLTFDDSPSIQFQNIGEATITGLEWSLKAQIGTLSHVFFNGSFVNGENDITGNPLSEIPALQNIIGLHFRDRNNKFFVQADAIIVGEQTDIAPNEQETPSYTVININAGLNLHELINNFPYTKVMIGATNLTDKAYRSHVSRGAPGNQNVFLEPGRSINIGFVTRFGVAVH